MPRCATRWRGGSRDRLDGATAVEITSVERPASGYSAETADPPDGGPSWRRRVRRAVRAPPGDARSRRCTRCRRRRSTSRCGSSTRSWTRCTGTRRCRSHRSSATRPTPSVLGAPFFVMGYVAGQVPIENPPYTQEGFFADASPDERTRMIDDGLRVLAGVHAVDWRAAGLDWLVAPGTTPGPRRPRSRSGRRTRSASSPAACIPRSTKAFEWLHAHDAPEHAPGLCWGDPRPGNIIWRDFRAGLRDRLRGRVDRATGDRSRVVAHVRPLLPRGRGRRPTRRRTEPRGAAGAVRRARATGSSATRTTGSCSRRRATAAIVVRVMNRLVDRGDLPTDQTIWIENPAVDCLVQLMEG